MARFRLARLAEVDIISLLAWTQNHFGEAARRRYEVLVITGLHDIASDPERPGSILRPELAPAIRSYHLINSRKRASALGGSVRRPRHLLLYCIISPEIVGVARVLHDGMELARHLPANLDEA